jgi:CheY-like chemotaxis protein
MRVTRSIVLVDDDQDDQEIFRSACARIDNTVNVIGFENGEQALASIPAMLLPPDVIFLDLNMPRLNGIEVLQELKLSSDLKAIPVVIYSTSFDPRIKDACSNLGAVEVMEKPNSFDTLCLKLQTVLLTLCSSCTHEL